MAGRPSFSITEYQQLAQQKNLEFLGNGAPSSVKIKTSWRCLNCGKEMQKSYHYLKNSKNSCRCQNGMSLPVSAYQELGKKFNIELISSGIPQNIFEEVLWNSHGNPFRASYHQLGYDQIPMKLRPYLEVP